MRCDTSTPPPERPTRAHRRTPRGQVAGTRRPGHFPLVITKLWPTFPVYTDGARPRRRTVMTKRTRRSILILTLALAGAVPGCDAWRTMRQCGLQGCPEDRRITAEIESLLAQHRALMPPNMVYVQTLDGVVYLSGQVNTPLQRTEAEDVARQAAGVRRVVNTISLSYRG